MRTDADTSSVPERDEGIGVAILNFLRSESLWIEGERVVSPCLRVVVNTNDVGTYFCLKEMRK